MKAKGILSFNEIEAESFIFYVGGFHTSASLMNFIFYELVMNQAVQEKLCYEITGKLKENDGKLSYESINEMKYLDMVVSEGLRKYPPINVVKKEYKIPNSNLVIPKGTQVTQGTQVPVYSLQRDPQYFPKPEKFDPERFSDENVHKIRPFTYLPFGKIFITFFPRIYWYFSVGEGPRICVGLRFGLMQTKIAIVKLLKEFKFEKCDETLDPMMYSVNNFVLAPKNDEPFLKLTKLSFFENVPILCRALINSSE
jgi:cytochrome P450 family 6